MRQAIQGADLLVCEATYLDYESDLAKRHGHLTARQAAELARETGINNLILTHMSRRYRERDVRAEAKSYFPGAIVARDFDHWRIRSDRSLERVED